MKLSKKAIKHTQYLNEKISQAEKAIKICSNEEDGPGTRVQDTLTNIKHYCNSVGLDFEYIVERAKEMAYEEAGYYF